jgi:hypothetical protein
MDRHTLKGTMMMVGLMMVGNAAAAVTARQVQAAYHCAVHQHEMLGTFHFYAYESKDKMANADFLAARQTALDCIAETVAGLADGGLGTQSQELAVLKEKIAQTSQYNANSLAKEGTPENAVVADMVQHVLGAANALAQAAKSLQIASKTKEVSEARQARELAILIMYANARYIERTTEVYHRDDSAERTIDQLASQFNTGLTALRTNKKLSADQKKKLDNVNTRFRFIVGSLNNYTQHAVPATVNRHARSMVVLLNQVANGLEGVK